MVTSLPLLASIALLNTTVFQQQQLIEIKQNMSCQYYDEPLRVNKCDGDPGSMGSSIIHRVPWPNQMLDCPIQQEIEPCFVPLVRKSSLEPQLLSPSQIPRVIEPPSPLMDGVNCNLTNQPRLNHTCRYTNDKYNTLADCTQDSLNDLRKVSFDKSCYVLNDTGIRAYKIEYHKNGTNGDKCKFFTLHYCNDDCIYSRQETIIDDNFYWFVGRQCSMDKDLVEISLKRIPDKSESFCPLSFETTRVCKPDNRFYHFIGLNIALVAMIYIMRTCWNYGEKDDWETTINDQLVKNQSILGHCNNIAAVFYVLFTYNFAYKKNQFPNNTDSKFFDVKGILKQKPALKLKVPRAWRACCCNKKWISDLWVKLLKTIHDLMLVLLIGVTLIGWRLSWPLIQSLVITVYITTCFMLLLITVSFYSYCCVSYHQTNESESLDRNSFIVIENNCLLCSRCDQNCRKKSSEMTDFCTNTLEQRRRHKQNQKLQKKAESLYSR